MLASHPPVLNGESVSRARGTGPPVSWGGGKRSGRTPAEQGALDTLLVECGMVDGFRACPRPGDTSATCWVHTREHWKRYDYALVSAALVGASGGRAGLGHGGGAPGGVRLVQVRHHADAFEGSRPDHLPVESVFASAVGVARGKSQDARACP